jgi:serine/threonine-protein kinase
MRRMSDRIGRVLDNKYRIIRIIGVGGTGTVYEAEHIVISRHVALKILSLEFVTNPEVVERFMREAKSASAIGHPNIIDIYDVGREDDKTIYIVMELLRGMSLSDHIEMEKRLDPTSAAAIAIQVLSALRAAHEKGIVHRDLKAGNVFLAVDTRDRKEVKLLDFGIAKTGGIVRAGFGLTYSGEIMGTPYCLSPEQARGADDVDARTDLWGVGVMLYEMLTGLLPYDGENYNVLLGKILLEEPRPMLEVVPDLPLELVAIVEKAMKKDREERYASAEAMLDALIPFVEHAAKDLLSSKVLKTIRGITTSFLPGETDVLASTPGHGVNRRSDPLASTFDGDLPRPGTLDDPSRNGRIRLFTSLALAAGLAVVVTGITLAFTIGGAGEASATTAQGPDESSTPSAKTPAPPPPEAALEPAAANPADAGSTTEAASKTEAKKTIRKRHPKSKSGWAPNPFR